MTSRAEPLVSILVPAFNAEATLAETLQSALASSYANLELILVDDGSADASAAIADRFARDDLRMRIFRQAHRGVSAALNFGLAQVRGDFVARLDADDLWHASKLAKQVGLLAGDPTLALAYTFVRYVAGSGRIVRDAEPRELAKDALCQCLYSGIIGGGSSVVFRRSILESLGGYDDRLSVWEDLVLHLKAAAAGGVGVVPEYLTGYRLRENSSSSDLDRSLANWRVAQKLIEEQFPQVPAFGHRWSDARRLLDLAEGFALSGRYAKSGILVAESMIRDPVRTSSFLAYRLHRRLNGRRLPLRKSGPLFANADVKTAYCLPDFDAGRDGARLRALESSRDLLLRTVDREIATPSAG